MIDLLTDNWWVILVALWGPVSDALAASPLKANGVVQFILQIGGQLIQAIKPKK